MKRRSEEEWAAVIADWRQSRLSARRYASSHGISVATLLKWGSRLGPSRRKSGRKNGQSRFLEIAIDEAPSAKSFLQIITPSGCRIEVPL